MIPRLADALGVDANTLFNLAARSDENPNVILVDDSRVILTDGLSVLEEVMPYASVTGFIWPLDAIEYAKTNPVSLAILDIELGTASGFDLCQTLLDINPRTNVIYLTAYADYSFDAWDTGACGFALKPLSKEVLQKQLSRLRYPLTSI